ncbi:MAG: undecaprenyl/decaprenyl-phosphate alpha-N-acetylglucosaminyl 1-phosphate transferase [Acidobacteria bacterium]|nr:undecaprenyl/decaprenyl-phosphate alpha-N-acetylglucosaminyl 1-phosphate transferase [Acidobacteriota bacterium]MCI0721156.1 undecaprenyl/decaprenyl-phosphate alpha-N-acetylglucosaminyl 1-phosphate transferase [Acidobacteriota bacterium]
MLFHLITFILALLLSWYLTPLLRQAALKFGIVDRPSTPLKNQREPVPYLGGLSVYLSFLLATGLIYQYSREVLGILLAGAIIVILGLIDDLGVLSPQVKLLGQFIAACVLVKASIYIKLAILPIWLAIPLTILWVMAITNAFNLIDIMDGLASGVGAIAALILVIVNYRSGRELIVPLSIALAGSLLGFLRYNFRPARIYLGDAGSLFVGLMLAALSMNGAYTRVSLLGAIAPLLILGVPIFDMLLVMYLRFRRGIPVMQGSPDHFALRLRRWRLSVEQTVLASYAAAALLGGLALLVIRVSTTAVAVIAFLTLLACLSIGYTLKKVDMSL